MAKRRIILPDWMKELPERCRQLEDDVKSLKAQVRPTSADDNVAQIRAPSPAILAGVTRKPIRPLGHARKSIHTPTFSSESKIEAISTSKVLNASGSVVTLKQLVTKK